MKTSKEIMKRAWKYPHYSYRSFDKDGSEYYYKQKPLDRDNTEWIPDISKIDIEKTVEYGGVISDHEGDWEDSLQSIEEYQKLINNENDNLSRP